MTTRRLWGWVLLTTWINSIALYAEDAPAPQAYSPQIISVISVPQESAPAPRQDPYKGVFYDNDFSQLRRPGAQRSEYYELLKGLPLGGEWFLDIGGEFRHQFKNENRRSLLTGQFSDPRTDAFDLWRTRVYGNLTAGEWFRAYAEFIDAYSAHEDLVPLNIDENRTDILNLFGEAKLPFQSGDSNWRLRVGRQELLEGSQRLVSPLDWGNTRRTFEGAKLLSKGKRWDHSIFWTRPVITDDVRFDQADQSQWFGGISSTYKCFEHQKFNPYFLILREEDLIPGQPLVSGGRIGSGQVDSRVYTAGMEITGELDNWLWNLEGAYQFGDYGDLDISAGMLAAGLGHRFSSVTWKPTFWVWYDYASGDEDPNDGTIGSFNQLFPLAHKYLGYVDLVGRTNIHDVNFQFFLNPHERLQLMAWFHMFWLAERTDGLYNAADVISFRDPTGASGREVGQELDLTATWKVRPGVAFEVGYCHFFSGDFIRRQGGQDFAYLLYTQLNVRF